MQTRYQKNLEKIAVDTLLSISQETMNYRLNLDEYSENEKNEGRMILARKFCREKLEEYDKPMPGLVKYCPYIGSYEELIEQSVNDRNIDVFAALIEYKNGLEKYESIRQYLEANFQTYVNSITDEELLSFLQQRG